MALWVLVNKATLQFIWEKHSPASSQQCIHLWVLVALNERIAKTVSSSPAIECCTLLCLYDNKRDHRQDYCFRRVPIVGILMLCVIQVYNITEKKWMTFNRGLLCWAMLGTWDICEEKKNTFQLFTRDSLLDAL